MLKRILHFLKQPVVFVVLAITLFYMTSVSEHLEPAIIPPILSDEGITLDIPNGSAPISHKGGKVMTCYNE